jgi:uncharacterized lipoprotein YmbA
MILGHRWWTGLLLVGLLCGCFASGGTTAYYTLHPAQAIAQLAKDQPSDRLIIGLGPVALPQYLDREAIVTRMGPNRLAIHDHHRWAGTLQSEISRVLAADLSRLTQVKQVVLFPWSTQIEPDLRFWVEILSFEGELGKQVTLKAAWSLTAGQSRQSAVRRVSVHQEAINGRGFEEMAAAMTRALTALSQEMADAVGKASVGN